MSDQPATSTSQSSLWIPPRDAKRDEQSRLLWELSASEREAAMYRGDLSLFQCLEWAARRPHEVPLINNEFAFMAIRTPEIADGVKAPRDRTRTIER